MITIPGQVRGSPLTPDKCTKSNPTCARHAAPAANVALRNFSLARTFEQMGLPDKAETLLLASHRDLAAILGERHRKALEAVRRVIELYDAWGKPSGAAHWRAACLGQ